ncbi:hypothetical protein BDA96_07G032800 [Sorghum bicolor]|uniref:Uncharacterized protein n=1 Tax=Sorghum bicolor TaxID=4558 RepID=A0A921QHR3_SORBI|nr:hypothetical protein BDA96_07G032800 [Sorghum bicolor]
MIERAIKRKVAMLESGELAAHRRELQMLRGIVVGELTPPNTVLPRRKKKKTDGGEVVVDKGAPGQQQEMDGDAGAGAGCDEIISRVDVD